MFKIELQCMILIVEKSQFLKSYGPHRVNIDLYFNYKVATLIRFSGRHYLLTLNMLFLLHS